jgi:hypothetical protein
MKKKEFNSRLNLGKNVISNLQQNSIQGGTDSIATATYIIVNTIRVLTENITKVRDTCPDPTPIDPTKITTFPPSCVETACPSIGC